MIFATLRFVNIMFFRLVGRLLFHLFKKRKKIALENFMRSSSFIFKTKNISPKRVYNAVRRSYANLGQTFADFLLLKWYTNKNIDTYVSTKNSHYLLEAIAKNRGVILSTAHFGSWELAAHTLALKGFKSLILFKKLRPAWLNVMVKRQRERSGNILIEKQNSFLAVYKHIKKGGVVTLLTDQHACPPEGEKMQFLGQEAWVHTSFVKLSLKTGALTVPAFMHNIGYFGYCVEFFPAIDSLDFAQSENAVAEMTNVCNKALEESIIKDPELWMWQHRKFKKL